MKKKIKDLTLEEQVKICKKQLACIRCPLYKKYYCHSPNQVSKKQLESEVEVDE